MTACKLTDAERVAFAAAIEAALTPEQRAQLDNQEQRIRAVRRRLGLLRRPPCKACDDSGRIVFGNSVWPCTVCR